MHRKIGNILLWGILSAYIITAYAFIGNKQKELFIQYVEVSVVDSLDNAFINKTDVLKLIKTEYPKMSGKTIKSIDKEKLEETIIKNLSIKNAEVYSTLTGNLCVNVEQRNPILRIINNNNSGYYIDEDGKTMQLSKKYTSRVLVASGNINKELAQDELFILANYIYSDDFWCAQINQIHVTKEKEYILIPRVGAQKIEFGKIDNYERKFNKLYALYTGGFSKTGWNKYNKINLKYKNQVVCTRK